MNIKTTIENRKELAQRLEGFNRGKLQYAGAPTFAYEGNGFRILRNGEIEYEDSDTEALLVEFLKKEGILVPGEEEMLEKEYEEQVNREAPDEEQEAHAEQDTQPGFDEMNIKIPLKDIDGNGLRNLIFMLHAEEYLLNRAVGNENIFVPDDFVEELKQNPPADKDSFLKIYKNYEKDCKGILFTDETVTFRFASTGSTEKNRALIELCSFIVKAARKATRVAPKTKKPENEKYYFRMWLLRIGMGTKELHESRMALLKDLKGYSAFRTEEEAKKHAARVKERRSQKAAGKEEANDGTMAR